MYKAKLKSGCSSSGSMILGRPRGLGLALALALALALVAAFLGVGEFCFLEVCLDSIFIGVPTSSLESKEFSPKIFMNLIRLRAGEQPSKLESSGDSDLLGDLLMVGIYVSY